MCVHIGCFRTEEWTDCSPLIPMAHFRRGLPFQKVGIPLCNNVMITYCKMSDIGSINVPNFVLQNLDCYTVTICVTLCECRGWEVKAETAADELPRVSMGGITSLNLTFTFTL